MSRFLPREGLTWEAIFGLLIHTILEPLYTGPILLVLIFCPEQILPLLFPGLRGPFESANSISSLKILFGCGVARKINNFLSRVVLNNFTSDTWNSGKEIVVVTGASNGIGAAIAREVSKTSVSVIGLDLYPPSKPFPSNFYYYKADLSKSAEISAVAEKIRKEHGDPTVLVNNAGIAVCRPLLSETEEQIRRVFDVNTISHFLTVKEFLPAMVKHNHGHIVTIASMSSYSVHAANIDYGCSKASALVFHEGLAQEIRSRYNAPKVRTTIVNPAYVRTPLLQENMDRPEFNQFVIEPETVADAVVAQLHSGNGAHLILPARYTMACALRAFPSWMQELARNSISRELAFLGTRGRANIAGMD